MVTAPVLLPLACLFAVFFVLFIGCAGSLAGYWCRGLLLLGRMVLWRTTVLPVLAIGPSVMVRGLLLGPIRWCLLSHRYLLSYRSGIQKYLIIPGTIFARKTGTFPYSPV